jgi:hypothetical protein
MAVATVPVSITPEADARIDELGIRLEVEQMLEYTRRTIPDLVAIEVERYDDPDEPGDPRIIIIAWQAAPLDSTPDRSQLYQWVEWFIQAFPSEVTRWVSFDVWHRDSDGR